jgi:hypothetical protein
MSVSLSLLAMDEAAQRLAKSRARDPPRAGLAARSGGFPSPVKTPAADIATRPRSGGLNSAEFFKSATHSVKQWGDLDPTFPTQWRLPWTNRETCAHRAIWCGC